MTNRNEQWKHEKDGLEILKELPALAEKEFKEIDPGDIERLKWAGIYAQRPRDGHFLVRVKLPSGQLTAAQAKVLADLAAAYGKGEIQITIRQAVQIHNITLRDAVDILPRLKAAGLSSVEACGDVPRTILGNPLAGVDAEELLDTRPLVEEVFRFFLGNRDFSNLPRKFKISISANPHDAGFARINDLAFVPARREGEAGFVAYVGGGLSAEPHLAVRLPFFIRPAEVKAVAEAVAMLFRDEGYREKRNHCRLKYLVADLGAERVAEKIEAQPGLCYVGVHVTNGHIRAEDLRAFAELAERFGQGRLRTTNSQNLILLDIPEGETEALLQDAIFEAYPTEPGFFTGYASSCTGNAYCNFAPIETKNRLHELTAALDEAFPEVGQPLRINLTGCLLPRLRAAAGRRYRTDGRPCARRRGGRARLHGDDRRPSWRGLCLCPAARGPRGRRQAPRPPESPRPEVPRTARGGRAVLRDGRAHGPRVLAVCRQPIRNCLRAVDNVKESDYNKSCNCILGELAASCTAG